MYDSKWVITGLALFVGVFIGFSVYALSAGGAQAAPQLTLPADKQQCVEDKTWMRDNHMQLLVQWREDVVRNGDRVYTSKLSGEKFEKSLTNTCLGCHDNKQNFCDSCHAYSGVTPNCWDCHNVPKEQHA